MHLTDVASYSNTLSWNKEYVHITDSFLLSQKKLLLKYGANVIESNILSQFSIDFPIKLNFHKPLEKKHKDSFDSSEFVKI